ncbi:MAG: hypothetical protein OCC46_09300 [Pseudodesulfovibrio sp.]
MRTAGIFFLLIFAVLTAPAIAMEVTVEVSSFKMDFLLQHSAENLLDRDPTTAWVGGGIGPGTGQWIDLIFGVPVRVNELGIFNGHQAPGEFNNYRRIRSGRILYPDGSETQFWLRDEPGEQKIKCRNLPFKSLRIVIDEVFPKGELTAKVKLAVSEIKFYMTISATPGGDTLSDTPDPKHIPAPPPLSPDKIVPEEIVALLKEFYVRQTTLAHNYHELFAEDVRDRNDFRFEVFKEVQRQRGTFKILKTAQVDTNNLGFELIEHDGNFAQVRVFGAYRVKVADLDTNLEEDSVFVVSKEHDGWKIVELEGEEELF